MTDVRDFLELGADRMPSKIAVVSAGVRKAYGELDEEADRLANAWLAEGLAPGDRVTIALHNSIEAVVCIFAALKAGAVFVPLHPEVKASKLGRILDDCRPRVVIGHAGNLPASIRAAERFVVSVGGPDESADAELAELVAAGPARRPARTRGPDDLAALLYTSGSTGVPRGVMSSHRNIDAASASIIAYLDNTADDVILDALPIAFDYGLYNVLMPLRFGGRVVLERPTVIPLQLIGLLQREQVTGLPLLPTLAASLGRIASLRGYALPHLRYLTSTGQPLLPAHVAALRSMFGEVDIYSMYGLTECKRVSYLPPTELGRRPMSVGKAMPRTEAWIEDANGRRIDGPDQVGELVVRGPHVMLGYWNMPEATSAVLGPGRTPSERTLRTQDLFRQDAEGYLYFVARSDDLIKVAGERVSPREVEAVALSCAGVHEAVAYGVEDLQLGQAIHLVVVAPELTAAQILAHCAEHLERHRVPRQVEIRDALPRTLTGKLDRRQAVLVEP